jgi:hypothetical protein
MQKNVLFVPLDEIKSHFELNARQDVKVVAPERMNEELFKLLSGGGKNVKPEQEIVDDRWKHSGPDEANRLCEAGEIAAGEPHVETSGPFALSFANEKAEQDSHYHEFHWEIYFSEHSMGANFKRSPGSAVESITLPRGGAIVFGPDVVHRMTLGGLTVVVEIPCVRNDKQISTAID